MERLQNQKWTLKFRVMLLLVALSVFSFLSACGGGGSSSSSTSAGFSTPANLHIISSSTHTIDLLQATPTSSAGWDYQSFTVLAPGGTHDFTTLPPDTYDFCAVSNFYEACTWGFGLASGATVTFTAHDTDFGGKIRLVNGTGTSITAFYYKLNSETTWSDNLLGTMPLSNLGTVTLPVTVGAWDFRVSYSGGDHDTIGTMITSFVTTTLNAP
jgi:hypothetical protein